MPDPPPPSFGYERELIVCSFLQDFCKGKGSNLQLICNAHTSFLLCGAALTEMVSYRRTTFGCLS